MTLEEIVDEVMASVEGVLASYQGEAERVAERARRIELEVERIAASGMTQDDLRRELAISRVDYFMTSERAQDLEKLGRAFAHVIERVGEKTSADRRKGGEGLKAANVLNGKTVEQRKAAVREAWASGKYRSRDACAEAEHRALGLSRKVARNALLNTPEPPLC